MLVLTRKIGEAIAIGEDIKVIVMQVKGKQVRLGIRANPSTVVHREEVYQRIHEENQLAMHVEKNAVNELDDAFSGLGALDIRRSALKRRIP